MGRQQQENLLSPLKESQPPFCLYFTNILCSFWLLPACLHLRHKQSARERKLLQFSLSSHKIIHRSSKDTDTLPSQLLSWLCVSKAAECWTGSTSISPKETPGLIATPRAALLGRQEKICLSSVEPFYETPDRGEHFSVEECFCLLFLLLPGKTLSKHL